MMRMSLFGLACIASLFLLAVLARPAQAQSAAPAEAALPLILPDGTPVRLKTGRDLSSATEKKDALVDFEVSEDVKVQDRLVIPRGSVALGQVILAQPKRRMGRTGKLEVAVTSVQLATGEKVPLRATQTAPDGNRVGTVATAVAVTGVLFFPAAPLFLLMKGKDIFIPKGTPVTAYVNGERELEAARFQRVSAPAKP